MFRERRILIFTGGNLGKWALEEIRPGDFLLGVDRGALFLLRNNLRPDFALGDFDSVSAEEYMEICQKCKESVSFDAVLKDYTDTELAFNWALEKRPGAIILLGALGNRFDHSLANVQLLIKGLKKGISCRIIGEKNEIVIIDNSATIVKGRFTNVSLLPLSHQVTGVTLEGFQYPLNNATLMMGNSLAISNALKEETGSIYIESGLLLAIKSMD